MRELLNQTSGLIDNNDIARPPAAYLRQVRDPALRAELVRVERRWAADPALQFPALLWVKFAAALPLLGAPGTRYHYSNIGYEIVGLIAEKVSGLPLASLYEQRIIEPLGLTNSAYDARGEISGTHARGYKVGATALMQGQLVRPAQLAALKTSAAAIGSAYALGFVVARSGCAGIDFEHGGAGAGFKTSVLVSGEGKRVAVVLANGKRVNDPGYYALIDATAKRLYCAA